MSNSELREKVRAFFCREITISMLGSARNSRPLLCRQCNLWASLLTNQLSLLINLICQQITFLKKETKMLQLNNLVNKLAKRQGCTNNFCRREVNMLASLHKLTCWQKSSCLFHKCSVPKFPVQFQNGHEKRFARLNWLWVEGEWAPAPLQLWSSTTRNNVGQSEKEPRSSVRRMGGRGRVVWST